MQERFHVRHRRAGVWLLGGLALLGLVGCESQRAISPPRERVKEINRIENLKELTSILAEDPLPLNRAAAASSLGRLGDERGVEPLIEALQDKDGGVRRDSALALGALEDARATTPLCRRLLGDDIPDVRRAAARALYDIGDRKAVSYLVEALTDPNESVVYNAHRALMKITGRDDLGRSAADWKEATEGA